MEANSKDTTDIHPKHVDLKDINPKDIDPKDIDSKDVDPKDMDPKDIDLKDSDLMLDSEQGMDEDRRREMLCHWAAATCHMTPRMWWVRHHLQDSDQELTQLEPGGESGSRQGWCK